MYQQMKFITTKDLGYDQEQVLVIPTHAGWTDESDRMVGRLREAAKTDASIISVSGTSSSFGGDDWSHNGYRINGETKFAFVYRADQYYLKTLGIELTQGRNFDESNPADATQSLIVNEALVRDMKWENPLQEHLNWQGDSLSKGPRVIGIVKDYNFMSLESKVEPAFLSMGQKHSGEHD